MNRNKNFFPSQSTYKQQSRLSLLWTAEGRIYIFRVSGVRCHKSQQRILEDIFLSSKFKMRMPKIHIFFSYLDQSCSASALLTFWDCSVYWWLFSSITGPHSPDGSDSSSLIVTPKMSPDVVKYPLGDKMLPCWEPLLGHWYPCLVDATENSYITLLQKPQI